MPKKAKTFHLSPWDQADSLREADRPYDECLTLEMNYRQQDLEVYPIHREQAGEVRFHADPQDTTCKAWLHLLELVDQAAADKRQLFWPAAELDVEDRKQIIELPPSIAKLKAVRRLRLYGSWLVRIPPEIGEMSSLRELDVYTSHRLHWLPYEITRCRKLRDSRVSTRSLYGNFKYRPPFPPLGRSDPLGRASEGRCSVCDGDLPDGNLLLVWISLAVGTDVWPLLVRACSLACVDRLPSPAKGYVPHPHRGGLALKQPPMH